MKNKKSIIMFIIHELEKSRRQHALGHILFERGIKDDNLKREHMAYKKFTDAISFLASLYTEDD